MNKAMIKYAIYWLNAFPSYNEVSDTLSPTEILQRLPNPNYYMILIYFVSYTQWHMGTKNTAK